MPQTADAVVDLRSLGRNAGFIIANPLKDYLVVAG
jgi:hypothetical protein